MIFENADHNDIFDLFTAQQKKGFKYDTFFLPDSTIFQKRDLSFHNWYDIFERNCIITIEREVFLFMLSTSR